MFGATPTRCLLSMFNGWHETTMAYEITYIVTQPVLLHQSMSDPGITKDQI